MTNNKNAVVLFSGGLDSTTLLAILKKDDYNIFALSFNYGQKHKVEIEKAKKIAKDYQVKKHLIIDISLDKIGGSALTDDFLVPKDRDDISANQIPITYVPARNLIFLSYAVSFGEVNNATDIFIGANVLDYSGYPDCRPDFIKSFEATANLGTKVGVEKKAFLIKTPLLFLTKAEIIKLGLSLNVDYSKTHSCYDPDINGVSCGRCDSCILRKKAFLKLGIKDKILYKHLD